MKQCPVDITRHSNFTNNLNYFYYNKTSKKLLDSLFPSIENCSGQDFFTNLYPDSIYEGKTIQLGQLSGGLCKNCPANSSSCIPMSNSWAAATGSFLVNIFDPDVMGQNVLPYESNSVVEITRTCCKYPYGAWFNVVSGSGIFYNLGNTQYSSNKVSMLYKLGFNGQQLVSKFSDFGWGGWGWGGFGSTGRIKYSDEKDKIAKMFGIVSLEQLFDCIADYTKVPKGNASAIYFMSISSDFDELLWTTGINQGYDTLQLFASGYGGFWAYEVIDCRQKTIQELQKSGQIFVADPANFKKREQCVSSYTDISSSGTKNLGMWCTGTMSELAYAN